MSNDLLGLQKQLSETDIKLRGTPTDKDTEELWENVAQICRTLANALRTTDGPVDNHTLLGKTGLPQTLHSLYTLAINDSTSLDVQHATPVLEILRVSANLCMDHDENRASLLDAGLPQALVALLESYAESIPSPSQPKPLSLSTSQLKVIRTAVGALLNASVGFEPIKYRLISLEAGITILKLSTAIYPTGSWISDPIIDNITDEEELEEAWTLRSSLSNWAWRTIVELRDVGEETKDETLQIFMPEVLPLLTSPLTAFTSHDIDTLPSEFPLSSQLVSTLLQADFENLEESCTLIESLSLDVEDIRLSLARGLQFPAEHRDIPCLGNILDFLEKGKTHPLWRTMPASFDVQRKEKTFDMCKTALIKTVVEVVGEERNEDVLWGDSEDDMPGGAFVTRMVHWLKQVVSDMESGTGSFASRNDLAICASLSLGNLARREKNATVLLSHPHSLAPVLASPHLLSQDLKVQHGVLALLKHLAQSSFHSPSNQEHLTKADTVRHISDCGIWDPKPETVAAMAEVVQVSAIGVVKHMCNANVENTYALVLPSTEDKTPSRPTGLSQILALVKRSESVPVKSEGTRVLVNVVKSLWSGDVIGGAPSSQHQASALGDDERKKQAMQAVLIMPCASALASLVARSGKYPLLVNEGVVALTLLSTQKIGAPLVLQAMLSPIVFEPPPSAEPPSASTSVATDVSSPTIATPSTRGHLPVPRTALDMLIAVLRNVDNPVNFQVEVRINVCSLLIQLGKNSSTEEEYSQVKDTLEPVIEDISESLKEATGLEGALSKAMKRVLETWETTKV